MKSSLATAPVQRGIKMPTKVKKCQFPDCEVEFEGIGASKYCEEHRLPIYRKVLNQVKAAEQAEIPDYECPQLSNQIIIHTHQYATPGTSVCLCGEPFSVTLYPSVDIYPKYCEKHRNPYQRKLLHEKLGTDDGVFHASPVDIDDIIPATFSSNENDAYVFNMTCEDVIDNEVFPDIDDLDDLGLSGFEADEDF